MLKVDLITGFLGSGKTTFLLKYARYLMNQGLRIGILEYDYGAVNVDMVLLGKLRGPKCELEMLAAACDEDCLRRRFQTKLIAMAMSGYDRVIIEPSGIFDMDQFFDQLRDDPLERMYEIGSVITVVNAMLRDDLSKEEDYYLASQAASAGTVMLSRTQLTDADTIAATKAHILRACENIKSSRQPNTYMEKDWEDLTDEDFKTLMNCGYQISDYVKVTAGQESDFSSVYTLNLPKGLDRLQEKLKLLFGSEEYGRVKRVKGFVSDGTVSYQVNATRYETLIDKIAAGQNTAIVIGRDLNKDKILKLLEEE